MAGRGGAVGVVGVEAAAGAGLEPQVGAFAGLPAQFGPGHARGDAGQAPAGLDAQAIGAGRRVASRHVAPVARVEPGGAGGQRPGRRQFQRQRQLGAAATGQAGVVEHRAPALAGGHHQFVGGGGLEQRHITLPARLLPAQAKFDVPAQCRRQVVQATGAVAAIRQFGEGRGLEAAAGIGVKAGPFAGPVQHAQHRRHPRIPARAAVVGIAGAHVAVERVEAHPAAAQATVETPALGRLPVRLQVHVVAAHGVVFVAAQGADHAKLAADEIFETQAGFVRPFLAGAQHQRQRVRGLPAPAHVEPTVVAVQVDHAAARGRAGLHEHRDRQHLESLAAAGVGHQGQLVAFADRLREAGAQLLLGHGLAGVEQQRALARSTAVTGKLGGRQPLRVIRGQVEVVAEHRPLAATRGLPAQLQLGTIAAPGRMPAVAVGGRALHVQPQPGACGHRPAPGRRCTPQPVGAGQAFGAGLGNRRRRLAENRHHAAAGIAVKHRKRAAQHLDAFGGRQQEVGNLALAVGHRRRDAVGVQAHPAHAEARTRAEAADRQLHVLGLVLALAHHHARDARQ